MSVCLMRVSEATGDRRPPLVSKLYGFPEPRKTQNALLLRDIDLTAVALAIDHELNCSAFVASREFFNRLLKHPKMIKDTKMIV
jgi:hypothetical protein